MSMDDPATGRILAFLDEIGIPVRIGHLTDGSFLPGMAVRAGCLCVDPGRFFHPGDLLHEAGHIAVTEPGLRPGLDAVADDPGEEMAAIAWSYAASVAIGLAPHILFHPAGYRGGSAAMIDNFTNGRDVGVPLLEWFGMTMSPRSARRDGGPLYPQMRRWLR
jgi:hypothetical protein